MASGEKDKYDKLDVSCGAGGSSGDGSSGATRFHLAPARACRRRPAREGATFSFPKVTTSSSGAFPAYPRRAHPIVRPISEETSPRAIAPYGDRSDGCFYGEAIYSGEKTFLLRPTPHQQMSRHQFSLLAAGYAKSSLNTCRHAYVTLSRNAREYHYEINRMLYVSIGIYSVGFECSLKKV